MSLKALANLEPNALYAQNSWFKVGYVCHKTKGNRGYCLAHYTFYFAQPNTHVRGIIAALTVLDE